MTRMKFYFVNNFYMIEGFYIVASVQRVPYYKSIYILVNSFPSPTTTHFVFQNTLGRVTAWFGQIQVDYS